MHIYLHFVFFSWIKYYFPLYISSLSITNLVSFSWTPSCVVYIYTVCVYIYIYIYICVCIYIYIYMYIYMCVCVYIYIYIYICVYIYLCIYIYIYIHKHINIYIMQIRWIHVEITILSTIIFWTMVNVTTPLYLLSELICKGLSLPKNPFFRCHLRSFSDMGWWNLACSILIGLDKQPIVIHPIILCRRFYAGYSSLHWFVVFGFITMLTDMYTKVPRSSCLNLLQSNYIKL